MSELELLSDLPQSKGKTRRRKEVLRWLSLVNICKCREIVTNHYKRHRSTINKYDFHCLFLIIYGTRTPGPYGPRFENKTKACNFQDPELKVRSFLSKVFCFSLKFIPKFEKTSKFIHLFIKGCHIKSGKIFIKPLYPPLYIYLSSEILSGNIAPAFSFPEAYFCLGLAAFCSN